MMDEGAGETRRVTMAGVVDALRKSRPDAAKEVNWLLVAEAREIEKIHAEASQEVSLWQESIDQRIAQAEDSGSTTDAAAVRQALEESRRRAQAQQQEVAGDFDERRAAFAEMLDAVRRSGKAPLAPGTLEQIHGLNTDGFLAEASGMSTGDFDAYYGRHTRPSAAQGPARPALTAPRIDFGKGVPVTGRPLPHREPARTPASRLVAAATSRDQALARLGSALHALESEPDNEMEF